MRTAGVTLSVALSATGDWADSAGGTVDAVFPAGEAGTDVPCADGTVLAAGGAGAAGKLQETAAKLRKTSMAKLIQGLAPHLTSIICFIDYRHRWRVKSKNDCTSNFRPDIAVELIIVIALILR